MDSNKARRKSEKQKKRFRKDKDKVNKLGGYYVMWCEVNYQISVATRKGLFSTKADFFNYSINEATKRWIIDKLLDRGYTVATYSNDQETYIGYISIEWKEEEKQDAL